MLTILAPCRFGLIFALAYILWTLTVHVLPGMGEGFAELIDTKFGGRIIKGYLTVLYVARARAGDGSETT